MIKTVKLNGTELEVKNLGGFNTVVHNLSGEAVYASKYPGVTAGADNVAEIPAGAAKLISTTNGTVYLLGTGKVEVTGQDNDSVNFSMPSSQESGGDGAPDVTKDYVDEQDEATLGSAVEYVDTKTDTLEVKLAGKADRSEIPEIPTALPADGGNADTVNGHTVNADVPENAAFTDTVYGNATSSSDGLQSAADKAKLDGVEAGANNYTLPEASADVLGGVKIGSGLEVDNGVLSLLMSPVMHRNIFRGKFLGNSLTAAQRASIQNGSFDDLFIGDYWVINNMYYRIVDMDYWLGCGQAVADPTKANVSAELRMIKHHLVVMPDSALYLANMADSATGCGKTGYSNTSLFKSNLNNAVTMVTAAFGEALTPHSELYATEVTNGTITGFKFYSKPLEIPSMIQMLGHRMFTSEDHINASVDTTSSLGTRLVSDTSRTQFSLFRLCPQYIMCIKPNTGALYYNSDFMWLRDSVNDNDYVYIDTITGIISSFRPNFPLGIRPAFALC